MQLKKLTALRQRRRWRIRKRVVGTPARPRLVVTFTNQHIYAQCIDDMAGVTVVSASSLGKEVREQALKPNVAGAAALGKVLATKAIEAGVNSVVFDRAGRKFHGTVKAFADAAREGGLSF